MARVDIPNLGNVPEMSSLISVEKYLTELNRMISNNYRELYDQFNGSVEIANLRIKEVVVADTGDADVEFAITHNLGRSTIYYISQLNSNPITPPAFYKGSTAWTSNIAYLKCTVANCNVTFLVIA